MTTIPTRSDPERSVLFASADLEVRSRLHDHTLQLEILKSGVCVHRVTVANATGSLENSWLAELFAREDSIDLGTMSHDIDDFVGGLDIRQG
jgi:hypothetical protein